MLHEDLSLLRLANQQVSYHPFTKPAEVVGWMGAMQAQDFGMVRWAVGLRLPEAGLQSVQRSIDKGEIIRTHVMRPTWHLVSSKDVRWMLDLTAPHIQASMRLRLKELELTPLVLNKSLKLFEQALADGDFLTREEMISVLENNRISAREQRAAHILIWAELEKILCNGALKGKKNTYALFERRVKAQKPMSRDAALRKLAQRYFTSHGPATVPDFINWSGLPTQDARKSIDLSENRLQSAKIGSTTYWFRDLVSPAPAHDSLYLLPAFDEFIIGYKDRSACLPARHKPSAISVNGIFWPVIVFNGQVIGLWKKAVARKEVKIHFVLFSHSRQGKKIRELLADASEKVSKFFSAGLGAAD